MLTALTDEQREIVELARSFARDELAPGAAARDRASRFDRGMADRLGALGFLGMLIPEEYDGLGLDTLSMGMTTDLEAAILEGATIVRVGTAIFGARGQRLDGEAHTRRT